MLKTRMIPLVKLYLASFNSNTIFVFRSACKEESSLAFRGTRNFRGKSRVLSAELEFWDVL